MFLDFGSLEGVIRSFSHSGGFVGLEGLLICSSMPENCTMCFNWTS